MNRQSISWGGGASHHNDNDDLLFSMWREGVELWYCSDYLRAMDVWLDIEESLFGSGIDGDGDEEEEDPVAFLRRRQSDVGASSSSFAPLLLFLAGCQLDAGNFGSARRSLRRSLSLLLDNKNKNTTNTKQRRTIIDRALSEYVAAYQEDPTTKDPTGVAFDIVNYGIENRLSNKWTNPYQRPGFLYPGIDSQPFYDDDDRCGAAWCRVLEDHYEPILRELQELRSRRNSSSCCWPRVGAGEHRGGAGAHDASVVARGDWNEMVLFGSGERPHLAPLTSKLLAEHVPDAVSLARGGGGEIVFSRLAPRTHIAGHCGTTNLRLTAHLGLVVPCCSDEDEEDAASRSKVRIRVANQWRAWKPGKVLVFDDSFEHEVINDTDEDRVVLLVRFWHWNLPVRERARALDRALQERNDDKMQRYHPPEP